MKLRQLNHVLSAYKSDHPGRASSLDFKETATPRFGRNDVGIDLFVETRFVCI